MIKALTILFLFGIFLFSGITFAEDEPPEEKDWFKKSSKKLKEQDPTNAEDIERYQKWRRKSRIRDNKTKRSDNLYRDCVL